MSVPPGLLNVTNRFSSDKITLPYGGPTSVAPPRQGSPGNFGLPAPVAFGNQNRQVPGLPSNNTRTFAVSLRLTDSHEDNKANIMSGRYFFVRTDPRKDNIDPNRRQPFTLPALNAHLSSPEGIRAYGKLNTCGWFDDGYQPYGVIQHDHANPDLLGDQTVITAETGGRSRMPLIYSACGRHISQDAELFLVLRKVKRRDNLRQLMGESVWSDNQSETPQAYWRLEPWFSNPGDRFREPPLDAFRGVIDDEDWMGRPFYVGRIREFYGPLKDILKTSEAAYETCFPSLTGMQGIQEKEACLLEAAVFLH